MTLAHEVFEEVHDFLGEVFGNGDLDAVWIAYVEHFRDGISEGWKVLELDVTLEFYFV